MGTHIFLPGECFGDVDVLEHSEPDKCNMGFCLSFDAQLPFYHLGPWN